LALLLIAVGGYRTVWSLEFKAHPPSEYDPLRKQVGKDLERLRQLKLEDKREWYSALQEGYKLANDQKQSDWAEEQAQIRFPSPWSSPANCHIDECGLCRGGQCWPNFPYRLQRSAVASQKEPLTRCLPSAGARCILFLGLAMKARAPIRRPYLEGSNPGSWHLL